MSSWLKHHLRTCIFNYLVKWKLGKSWLEEGCYSHFLYLFFFFKINSVFVKNKPTYISFNGARKHKNSFRNYVTTNVTMSSCEKLTWKSTKEGKSYFVRIGMRETKEKKVNKIFIMCKPYVSTYNLYYFCFHLTTMHLTKQSDEFHLQLTIIPFYEFVLYIDRDKVTNSLTATVRPLNIITMCIDRKQSGVFFLFHFQNKEF